ncbi:P2X purinoceptor 2 [Amia ocellicauda]|uniref:P2X purinoceptor 2 n=1 Tax=Amia ocellicauda TaxID=2972642 RepID=UPI003464C417
MGLKKFIKDYFVGFWDYETTKVIVVKNRTLGVIYRLVQFLVIMYFIWYVFISQKAYQERETRPQSSIYTKMKGMALLGGTVQDMVEYVRPSEVRGLPAAFRTVRGTHTKVTLIRALLPGKITLFYLLLPPQGGDVISTILRKEITYDQQQGVCAEHYKVPNANCTTDSDCIEGMVEFNGNGQRTGRCVPYYNHTFKTCEIKSWCPIEEFAVVKEPCLAEAVNFTVYIKNTIHFANLNVLRGNIEQNKTNYLDNCTYDEVTDMYCPIFKLGYIARKAKEKFSELCETGGVIGIYINWKCDLDLDPSECNPEYSFRRLDMRKNLHSSGYHYRFAKFYSKNGSEFRTLIKAYGIRLDVIVHGEAGKFRIIPTVINMVTALTSVGICSFVCDWILLTFIDKNEVYSDHKFDEVWKDSIQNTVTEVTEVTEVTSVSRDSTHSDLSEGVAL